jgi:hypothetical protein
MHDGSVVPVDGTPVPLDDLVASEPPRALVAGRSPTCHIYYLSQAGAGSADAQRREIDPEIEARLRELGYVP